jgi:glutaredoxin-like protein NrdH
MAVVNIPGKKSHHIMLYALSTCGWCQKTRKLLDDLGVEYNYEYVDLLQSGERERAIKEVSSWNPTCNFPTMVIDNKKCIAGYQENAIREALQK